ncbi:MULTISPECIES: hypothetical protein [Fibrobacter]|uniref:Outer membrane protein beta-barrel domain-containing protein n=1 Tax=Fibrobacter intestinalis TaxID=28122 RepID=A0A1M6W4U0_9BACT|nr:MULTISPECIES: hypothetical protein [Fibrobacter]MDD7298711.1 hypothetical protein [Fibrobacter intestinalis]PBC67304.1 hypothetical protein BGX14_2951 [Fibrobacter sp. UWS1]SHK88505.1 hypothetical protein SAMN05720469_1225 [Fibrobacter intestinalis]
MMKPGAISAILWGMVLAVSAHAGFFLEKDHSEEEVLVKEASYGFSWGGGAAFAYYLGGFDFSLSPQLAYRFQNDLAIASELALGLNADVHEAGLSVRAYIGDEDFVSFGSSAVYFKKHGDWLLAPRLFVDYGRNMKPWRRAHFALQGKVRLGFVVGESLGRERNGETKTAFTTISGTLAFIFF